MKTICRLALSQFAVVVLIALTATGCRSTDDMSTRPKLTLAHNIQIPKEWSAGSENPGMTDCGMAERYVSAYDRGWWIAVQRYAEDINFDDPSALAMSGWAEESYGGANGYGAARDRIEELIRVYGKQRVSEYLQQFKLPDEAVFAPWGWENTADAKAYLEVYKQILLARVDACSWEDKGPNHLTPLHFKATVIRSFKGDWQPAEKIAFVHYLDAPAPAESTTNNSLGQQIFIFANEHTNAEITLQTGEWGYFRAELAPALECLYSGNPKQVTLTVMQGGTSNVVFRIKNNTTNIIRLPSAGYVPLDSYAPVNTNPASAIFRQPEVKIGLWLTHDWRQVGTNWMFASRQEWEERLKIQTLKPGDTLDIIRSLGPWSDLIQTNTNAVTRFEFLIPQDFAEEYDLWQGSLYVTGITETVLKKK